MESTETTETKKRVVEQLLRKGVLVSPDLIDKLDSITPLTKTPDDFLILSREIECLIEKKKDVNWQEFEKLKVLFEKEKSSEPYKNFVTFLKAEEERAGENDLKVVFSYAGESRKRSYEDFVSLFAARYNALRNMLQGRHGLQDVTSINRINSRTEREKVSLIGLIQEKHITKNKNMLLTVEDQTGSIRVLISKNKPELYNMAKDLVHDEVIGISGVNGDKVVFANNLLWPDIPDKPLKKTDEDVFVVFLSDLHVGSKNFLPEEFNRFIKWINGQTGNEGQRKIAEKVKYVFIAGDLVDGVGVYPEQNKELEIDDIHSQYEECARLLSQIPQRIKIIVCPGNHDSTRMSEPQPAFTDKTAKALLSLPNIVSVSNPSILKIGVKEGFDGFTVLLYHGYSFDYYVANVDSIRQQGGYDRADLLMKFLLQRRHMAPAYSSTLYLPEIKDYLVIDNPPDFFVTGHIHKTSVSNYKNTTLISGSCWQSKTLFQEKVGHHPEPAKVPVANLRTREIKILKFGD